MMQQLLQKLMGAKAPQVTKPLPPIWWDIIRRNPGRLTVLLLIFVHEVKKDRSKEDEAKQEETTQAVTASR